MFFVRTRWVWYGMSTVFIPGVVGYVFGGVHSMIGCVLFSGLLRGYLRIFVSQFTGSICHAYGYRRFEVEDASTNEFVTTILTFGEGLHNNHHRFPRDACISHAWWEIDLKRSDHSGHGEDRPRPRRLPRLAPPAGTSVRSGRRHHGTLNRSRRGMFVPAPSMH